MSNGNTLFQIGSCWALMVVAVAAPTALGGGFQIPTQSARAAGQGDAFTAQADDPSAVYYNPAGLTQLSGTQISAGLYTLFPEFGFESATGEDESNNEVAYIPHAYATTGLGPGNLQFGLGVNSVFGLLEDWGDNGALSPFVTQADLNVLNIAPTLAYAVGEHLSFGLSLNVYYGAFELNNKPPLPGGRQGAFRIEGDDVATGVTLGTLWKISDQHSIGLVYRSPFTLDFEGSAEIDLPGLPAIGPSDTTAGINFPQIIVLGYAFRPTKQLTLEADLQWADWNALNDVQIESDDPRFSSMPPLRLDFESSFTYRFGAHYQLDPTWTIRAGYIYSPTSSPEGTFTPAIVDLNSHVFTAGLGYNRPGWSLDVAYRFILGVDREINNSINSPPGEYSDITHAIVITATFGF